MFFLPGLDLVKSYLGLFLSPAPLCCWCLSWDVGLVSVTACLEEPNSILCERDKGEINIHFGLAEECHEAFQLLHVLHFIPSQSWGMCSETYTTPTCYSMRTAITPPLHGSASHITLEHSCFNFSHSFKCDHIVGPGSPIKRSPVLSRICIWSNLEHLDKLPLSVAVALVYSPSLACHASVEVTITSMVRPVKLACSMSHPPDVCPANCPQTGFTTCEPSSPQSRLPAWCQQSHSALLHDGLMDQCGPFQHDTGLCY